MVDYHFTDKSAYRGQPKEIWVWIDKDFAAPDQEGIIQAVTSWNQSLNGFIKLQVANPNSSQPWRPEQPRDVDWIVTKVAAGDVHFPLVKPDVRVLACVDVIGGHNIYIAKEIVMDDDIYYISMHEMAHLLGADHKGDSLMYPLYDKDRFHCIDPLTTLQVALYNNLPPANLNYCTKW